MLTLVSFLLIGNKPLYGQLVHQQYNSLPHQLDQSYLYSENSVLQKDIDSEFKSRSFPYSSSKFKSNRKTINYTALGIAATGVSVGLLTTLICQRNAGAGNQCDVGVFIGSILGITAAGLTLLIAHPINRIRNKKHDNSENYENTINSSIAHLKIGSTKNGIGIIIRY